jgi:hypothetical protein
MTPVKNVISEYKSTYAASKDLKVTATQLDRLSTSGAMVTDSGEVWIRSKTVLANFKKGDNES